MCLWKMFICTVCSFIHHSCIHAFNNCYADSTLPFQLNNQDKAPHLLGKPSSWGPHCPHHLLRTQQREAFRIGRVWCFTLHCPQDTHPGQAWRRLGQGPIHCPTASSITLPADRPHGAHNMEKFWERLQNSV